MNLFKTLPALFFLILATYSCKNSNSTALNNEAKAPMEVVYRIPAGENSWSTEENSRRSRMITAEGIQEWTKLDSEITSHFRTKAAGKLQLGLRIRAASGPAILKIDFAGKTKQIKIENQDFEDVNLGTFELPKNGYHSLKITPVEKTGASIVDIEEILLGGPATAEEVNFVEENFHFGRRGPSVHLRYELPKEKDLVYFYNEIEVPEGEDVIGSYFMANGFSHGYFGIQVNSPTERRILFSVWSPFETQNPEEIPEEYQIDLLKKGEDVVTGKFGNEGSGGQSYKRFNWKADTTYGFLLKGQPNGDNSTDFTAYFFAPEIGEWQLIASFNRPHTDTYLKDLYSFLENFVPATGDTSRKALYKNQWAYDTQHQWTELTKAEFTADATARAGHRKDYAGGVTEKGFYLKDCGFFDDFTTMNTNFERETQEMPESLRLFVEHEREIAVP